MSRLRVLLIAEAANPRWPSVPRVGWSLARALGELVDTHLVTQVRNREALQEAGQVQCRDFTAIDSEVLARPLWRVASFLGGRGGRGWTFQTGLATVAYPLFESRLWDQFGERIRGGQYDLVHRITPLSPTAPSLLAARCHRAGVPFVLGPLNGGLPWPRGFRWTLWREGEWLCWMRRLHRLVPSHRSMLQHSTAILVGSLALWRQLPSRLHSRCFHVAENGVDRAGGGQRCPVGAALPLRVVFVGRLVPYKNPDLLIEAAAPLVRSGAIQLDIAGDGPLMPSLRGLISGLGLQGRVKLRGWLTPCDVEHLLLESDLLVLPSVREFGGGVVLEAMSCGTVPVVVDYGGPGELVTPECGFLVELCTRHELRDRLRRLLARLVTRPEEIARRWGPARQRIAQWFTWEAKAQQICEIYQWILGHRCDRPAWPEMFARNALSGVSLGR